MEPPQNHDDSTRILIAEDSPTQAERLRYLLEENSYTVMTVANGKQALAAAQEAASRTRAVVVLNSTPV